MSNIVNQISNSAVSGISKLQEFDLNDDTFANLLKKASENRIDLSDNLQALGNIGQPAGLIIESINSLPIDAHNTVNPVDKVEIKDVDTGSDYFANLLKQSPQEHTILMNVAKKHATNIYNNIGRNLIENITDFAKDVAHVNT